MIHYWCGGNLTGLWSCLVPVWHPIWFIEGHRAGFIVSEAKTLKKYTLRWRHNGGNSVSNHQPNDCLLNRLFGRWSKKTSKLRVTGLCVGNSPGPVNSPHKWPVTRKIFPFYDVIMCVGIIHVRKWYKLLGIPFVITEISKTSIEINAWISNCIRVKQ